jgi:hypothetical protein
MSCIGKFLLSKYVYNELGCNFFFCFILKLIEPLLIQLFLCFSAATVASQWLELLHQDIKGRLAGNAIFISFK